MTREESKNSGFGVVSLTATRRSRVMRIPQKFSGFWDAVDDGKFAFFKCKNCHKIRWVLLRLEESIPEICCEETGV